MNVYARAGSNPGLLLAQRACCSHGNEASAGECRPGRCWFPVSVNSSNAVDKREQPPRKDGCSLFHVNAGLRRKKMERRLQEKQIPIGLLSKQVVLQVEEAAQFSGGGIRYKVKGKRQLQQRSRQKGTATQERWLFPFSCKRRVTAKKDGEKTPREANPHWAP